MKKKLPQKGGSRSGKQEHLSDHNDRRQPRFSRELFVLYEDDAVVVLDKPAGLPAVPVKGSDTPSALSLLSLCANIDETESAAIITEQGGQENHRGRNQGCSSFCDQLA